MFIEFVLIYCKPNSGQVINLYIYTHNTYLCNLLRLIETSVSVNEVVIDSDYGLLPVNSVESKYNFH